MKKCEYCAKEISYHQMHCDDICEEKSLKFYDKRERYEKLIAILNGICVMSIGVGFFVFAFNGIFGAYMITIPLLLLGIMFSVLPIPADVMINKYKIKKAEKITRIIGFVVMGLGIISTIIQFFYYNTNI